MDVQIADLDDLATSLQRALDRIGELRAGTRVDSDAFFSEPFMRDHTEYEAFSAFRADAPVELDVPIDDTDEHRQRVNAFVADVTDFETWEALFYLQDGVGRTGFDRAARSRPIRHVTTNRPYRGYL